LILHSCSAVTSEVYYRLEVSDVVALNGKESVFMIAHANELQWMIENLFSYLSVFFNSVIGS